METAEARALFERSAPTYDRVNAIVSLGLDSRWRDWAARAAGARPGARVLDAFAGTGLVGIRAAELGASVTLADASPAMLDVATRRARERGVEVGEVVTDLAAPGPAVPGAPFDAATMVFGARYLDRPADVVRSIASSLRPGAPLVIVDFVVPDRGPVTDVAAGYFFHVLPRVAAALSGDRALYERLTSSTRAMGRATSLISVVRAAGLSVTETRRMGFGLVLGIVGVAS